MTSGKVRSLRQMDNDQLQSTLDQLRAALSYYNGQNVKFGFTNLPRGVNPRAIRVAIARTLTIMRERGLVG